jgi:eukaryotic-like serine/threonine-protein kinase
MPEFNDEQWANLEKAIHELAEAWKTGAEPELAQFLPCGPKDPEFEVMLAHLVAADQECREKAGRPKKMEEYLRDWPELSSISNLSIESATIDFNAPIPVEGPGSRVGSYKLLGILGEGGFGIVYLAEQEKPICRRVALKILKAGMDTKQIIARFEAERQALAMMDHTNIAKIFDAGTTDTGRSYFAMELVHGERITAYCDRHRLPLEERLTLFVPVCQAVQHAHQKGIIHRDIKPSNVLVAVVDDQPVPKIIDFGVAKAMAQPLTEQSVFTEQGQLIGTPEYMSPEQAEMSNLDIDTRSDIYSLGVLLYELLTGDLPFDRRTLRQAGLDEIRRIIREVEPPKPSTKISTLGAGSRENADKRRSDPQSLRRRLRQELDWIVMKTLEKDRTRRYATAMALAEDIQRYLTREPVQAGPPGNWYRFSKYARRYRMPLGIVAVFAAFLVAITLLAVRGYYRESSLRTAAETAEKKAVEEHLRAEREKEKAKANFEMALDAVKKYYTQVADDPRLKPHNLETLRRDLLESANEFYEKLINQEADDTHLQLERVWAYIARGEIEMAIGNRSEAETAYKNALAGATRLTRIYGEPASVVLTNSLHNLGCLYAETGRAKEAETAYQAALPLLKILMEMHPEIPRYQDGLATLQGDLGNLYYSTGRADEAEAAYKEAIAVQKILAEKDPESPKYQNNLASFLNNLGLLYQAAGRATETEMAYKEALAIFQILAEKHPEAPEYQKNLASSHDNLGIIYQAAGRTKEAEAAYEKALAIAKILAEKHPEVPKYQNDLADSINNLGNFYHASCRAKEAEAAYKEALAIFQILAQTHPGVPEYQDDLSGIYNNLGILYQDTDRSTEAEAAQKEALAIQKNLAEKHPEVPNYQNGLAASHYNLGNFYQAAGRSKEAEAAYEEALAIQRNLVEKYPEVFENQKDLACSHCNLGNLYYSTGRTKEAEAAHKEAFAIQKTLVEEHPETPSYQNDLANSYYNLGYLHRNAGRAKEAEAAYVEAIAIWKTLVAKHSEVLEYQNRLAGSLNNLAKLYQDLGRADEADTASNAAIAIQKNLAEKQPAAPK